jgi:nucleotide-binding universal stress UspA family protein
MKVVIGTDGSEFSSAAIDACGQMIERGLVTDVTVVAVYEAQAPIAAEPVVVSSGYYQKLNDMAHDRTVEAADEAVKQLEAFATEHPAKFAKRVEMGQPGRIIVEAARDLRADLVIVGSHGRGFWGRLALGSVSDSVVHNAPCSVLVVRTHPFAG